mmetsp:Transcript_41774/g.70526  ORF Transcript_41774/g.70526 Transcript_41774/m.70526 type:complete len:275 (+) Transcript_41774:1610-2434(+)
MPVAGPYGWGGRTANLPQPQTIYVLCYLVLLAFGGGVSSTARASASLFVRKMFLQGMAHTPCLVARSAVSTGGTLYDSGVICASPCDHTSFSASLAPALDCCEFAASRPMARTGITIHSVFLVGGPWASETLSADCCESGTISRSLSTISGSESACESGTVDAGEHSSGLSLVPLPRSEARSAFATQSSTCTTPQSPSCALQWLRMYTASARRVTGMGNCAMPNACVATVNMLSIVSAPTGPASPLAVGGRSVLLVCSFVAPSPLVWPQPALHL